MIIFALIPALLVVPGVFSKTYNVVDTFIGKSFLTGFDHIAEADPTHGRVNYTDQAFALSKNLTFASSDTFIIRADYKTVLTPSGPGRNSVRIQSKKQYTTAVTVLDARWMPQGCGTWPAFWTTNTVGWPNGGEIDIIEGVNDVSPNHATLHTTSGCTMSSVNMQQTGTLVTTDCNWQTNGNAGCGVSANKPNNYGPSFNANGGGWYAMERTASAINIWFWGRNDATVPNDVKTGSSSVNPTNWGKPFANFVNNNCPFSHFAAENIIINLTLCGDWAGAVYPSSCPKTCIDHVNQDPADFKNAYWQLSALRAFAHRNADKLVMLCVLLRNRYLAVKEARDDILELKRIVSASSTQAAQGYVNYADPWATFNETDEYARKAFGSNYPRLEQVKKQYDPEVAWNRWFTIRPAEIRGKAKMYTE